MKLIFHLMVVILLNLKNPEVSYHIKAGDPLIMARPVKLDKI